jgi:hypothetical protein
MVGLLIVSSITAGMMVRVPQLASAMIGHAKIDIGLMNKVASGVHQAKEYVSPKKGRRNWVREEY